MSSKKQKVNILPTIPYNELKLSESAYHRNGRQWKATTLIQHCKEKEYPIFDMPLAGIDLSYKPFQLESLDDFIYQIKRVEKTDLKYPIIIDDNGVVADGYHRIAKALLEGRTSIKAIRMLEMPCDDGVYED